MIVDYLDPDAERERQRDDAEFWANMERASQGKQAEYFARHPLAAIPYRRPCPTCCYGAIADDQIKCQNCLAVGATDVWNTHYEVHL